MITQYHVGSKTVMILTTVIKEHTKKLYGETFNVIFE